MDQKKLAELVREVVLEVVREMKPEGAVPGAATPAPVPTGQAPLSGQALVAASAIDPLPRPGERGGRTFRRGPANRPLPAPRSPEALARIQGATPARVVTGRTGTRYLTESYLGLRADHAIAIDAVESQVDEAWATPRGYLPLRSRATDHQDFLLHPDHGRRLDDPSKARCEKEADRGVDIQIIAGDGLSAVALKENGPPLVEALLRTLSAAGFRVGKPLFVKFARIGVQDEIGVLTQAKSTIILVGERPGLGTGDSLSIYTAFAPRLGQDNSEKDCISNVRTMGFPPPRAAERCAQLMRATFTAGGGGMKLVEADQAGRR